MEIKLFFFVNGWGGGYFQPVLPSNPFKAVALVAINGYFIRRNKSQFNRMMSKNI